MSNGSNPLNLLLIEDSPDDAVILVDKLEAFGFSVKWKRVETEGAFLTELEKLPDIILSDYSMPLFTGIRAAQLLRSRKLNIPFILVSGTVGEEIAVEAMKHGVTDYFLKDRTSRLGIAIQQALAQKRLRDEKEKVELSLRLFRDLIDQSNDGVEVIDPETGRFIDVNETTCSRLGYCREKMLSMRVQDIASPALDDSSWRTTINQIRLSGHLSVEGTHRRRDGSTFPVEINVRYIKLDQDYLIAAVRDVTERKRKDKEIQEQLTELQRWHEVMVEREDRVLELKEEVNSLLTQRGISPRYSISEQL